MSGISLAFVSFVNYFFVPVLGMKIYVERNQESFTVSFNTIYRYVLYTVLNIPFTRVFINFIERFLSNDINSESAIYTIVATISIMILTYVSEVVEKIITVDIDIEKKDKKGQKR